MSARLIAALVTRLELAAGCGALFINRAANRLSDLTAECYAAAIGLVRATHGNVVVVERFGQGFGNGSVRMRGGLPPIE